MSERAFSSLRGQLPNLKGIALRYAAGSRVTVLIFFQSNCARRRRRRKERHSALYPRGLNDRPIFFCAAEIYSREIAVRFTRRRDVHETRFDRLAEREIS